MDDDDYQDLMDKIACKFIETQIQKHIRTIEIDKNVIKAFQFKHNKLVLISKYAQINPSMKIQYKNYFVFK